MTRPTQFVFIVERGVYNDRYIDGVYATLESAMASAPGKWQESSENMWDNDKDWGDAASIWREEVKP